MNITIFYSHIQSSPEIYIILNLEAFSFTMFLVIKIKAKTIEP